MEARRRQRCTLWDRCDVPCCVCSALTYKHTHCPCELCLGAAVGRSTEFRHWLAAKLEADSVLAQTSTGAITPRTNDSDDSPTPDSEEVQGAQIIPTLSQTNNVGTHNTDENRGEEDTAGTTVVPQEAPKAESTNTVTGDIVWSITEAMQLVDDMDASQHNFMQILSYGRHLYERGQRVSDRGCELQESSNWPQTWQGAMKLLEEAGYIAPKTLYVCLNASHYCNWDVLQTASELCRHCEEPGSIKYYYMSLHDKVRRWCSDPEFCNKMSAHWRERDHWLGVNGWWPRKEIWDGTKFSDLSWFWNPEEKWLLPVKCPQCASVVAVSQIEERIQAGFHEQVKLSCEECHTTFLHSPQYSNGDPRNIALIGHWDGFNPFRSTGQHSCGSIEVSIANMEKTERSRVDEVYVLGFVPCYCLPRKRSCLLDPFLHPLISEVENAFIHGIEVDYRGTVAGIAPGKANIRCLILCWTGDYPAQCEIGKCIKNGKHPCRRDKLEGTLQPGSTTHYYGNFRYHARYGWPARSLDDSIEKMKAVEDEDRVTVRAVMAKEAGFTGVSILHRLHQLYGFDVQQDLVYDAMHNVPMNVVGQHLHHYQENGFFSTANKHLVEKRLNAMPWTAELRSGRIPTGVTHRLGYWKAEELHKFTFPASECILGGILPQKEYHIWILIVRLTELVFGAGRAGWSEEMLDLARRLIFKHNVLTEEVQGLSKCHVTFHNLIHMVEDVMRFSSPDNYWCFSFERAVCKYVERSSNKKNIECTFANAESRREFLKFCKCMKNRQESPQLPEGVLHAKGIDNARCLATAYPNLSREGIFVGKQRPDDLSQEDQQAIGIEQPVALYYRAIFLPQHGYNGMQYRVGEYVFIEKADQVIKISAIFAASCHGVYQYFVKGEQYVPKVDDKGEREHHPYSDSPKLTPSCNLIIVPTIDLSRKVMLYPDPENVDNPLFYVLIDYLRPCVPLKPADVLVPFYPEKNDMVLVQGDGPNELWLAHIQRVEKNDQTCHVYFYVETAPGSHIYCREHHGRRALETIEWGTILAQAKGKWNGSQWDTSQ